MSYTVHALATRLWGMVGQGEGDRIVTALPPEDDPATVDLQAVLPGDGSPGMLLIGEVDASGFGYGPTAETAMVAGLLGMLERRERTAHKAYRECDAAVERAEHDHGYLDSRAVAERARRLYASSRWTEAQEALAEARRISTTLTV